MNTSDLSHHWLRFTANRDFPASPRLLVGAKRASDKRGEWWDRPDGGSWRQSAHLHFTGDQTGPVPGAK
jgi:hypothetical protein